MICPYNGFKDCDWKNCAARMYVKDEKHGHGATTKPNARRICCQKIDTPICGITACAQDLQAMS